MITSPFTIKLRNFTRSIGLNKIIAQILSSDNYEDSFGNALNAEIIEGDTVWDIGANLGIYTKIFLESVSSEGQIVAYEPAPSCFEQLQCKFSDANNVIIRNIAIGSQDEFAFIDIDKNPLAATHKIISECESLSLNEANKVEIRSSDSIIEAESQLIPNIIKIDVEGYEGQVVDGMKGLLGNPKLRCVGIEVHFGLLSDRGEENRPQEIESIFRKNGFLVRWTDSSHIIATR